MAGLVPAAEALQATAPSGTPQTLADLLGHPPGNRTGAQQDTAARQDTAGAGWVTLATRAATQTDPTASGAAPGAESGAASTADAYANKSWRKSEVLALHRAREMAPDFTLFLELARAMLPSRSRADIVAMLRSRSFAAAHAEFMAKDAQRAAAAKQRAQLLAPAVELARAAAQAASEPVPRGRRPNPKPAALGPADALTNAKGSAVLKSEAWLKTQLRARARRPAPQRRPFVRKRLVARAKVETLVLGKPLSAILDEPAAVTCLVLASQSELDAAYATL